MREIHLAAEVDAGRCQEPLCRRECPAKINVPLYIDLIRSGRMEEAYAVIRDDNPFPSVCGRVCPNPCEGECRRGVLDAAVSIRALKRFPGDVLAADGALPKAPRLPGNGKRVAVVGAGPAGMTAAFFLARKGYGVTVFERNEEPGGMMRYGIPAYRLPREVLGRELAVMRDLGIEIRTGFEVGRDMSVVGILADGFGAVYLAAGANREVPLDIPGEAGDGVYSGIGFLHELNADRPVDLTGKRVAVIGGGNVASDAARSALRLGACQVTLYYRRVRSDMPASDEEVRDMEREGVEIVPLTAPVRVLREGGRVTGLTLTRMEQGEKDAGGRLSVHPVPNSELDVEADAIISAVGYRPDAEGLDPALTVSRQGSVSVDRETQATSLRGVFAGGDCVSGPTSIITAVAEGKRGAAAIDRFLGGDGAWEREGVVREAETSFTPTEARLPREREHRLTELSGFRESVGGYTLEEALRESERCLQCDVVCHICEELCPVLAIKSKSPGLRAFAQVDALRCSGCGMCEQRCPNQAITLKPCETKVARAPELCRTLTERVEEICAKAHMQPQQVVCYCHRVRAEEVVAAILSGADTPEEVAHVTGARTGCGVLCITSVMRLLAAADKPLDEAPGNQWYGATPSIWTLSEEVIEKYDAQFHLRSDREHMNLLFPAGSGKMKGEEKKE